jgi:septal ring factor EnvC (AmiA/AmiB activator)
MSSTSAAMGNNNRNHHDREDELAREVDRLRSLLRQAWMDAEQSLRETEASERRRVRDVTEERARTHRLVPTSTKYVTG